MRRGELLERVTSAIKAAGKKGITTEELAATLACNRQYVRKLIRTALARKVKREGSASPSSEPVYIWRK